MDLKEFERRLLAMLLHEHEGEVEEDDASEGKERERTVIPREQLLSYIQQYAAQGVERERIRTALLRLNVAEEEVDAAFALLEGRPLPDPEKERWEERKPLLATILLVFLLSAIAIFLLIEFFPQAQLNCTGTDCLATDHCSARPVSLTHTEQLRGARFTLQLDGMISGRSLGGCRVHLTLTRMDAPAALEEFAASVQGEEMECVIRDESAGLEDLVAQCSGPLKETIAELTE